MVSSILNSCSNNLQMFSNFKDEKRNVMDAFKSFLDEIILAHAKKHNDHWSLFVCDLSHGEKKIFLSYMVDLDTYEDLTANFHRELEAIKEYAPEMQHYIDVRIDDFYHEYMEDKKNSCDKEDGAWLTTSLT